MNLVPFSFHIKLMTCHKDKLDIVLGKSIYCIHSMKCPGCLLPVIFFTLRVGTYSSLSTFKILTIFSK